MSSSLNFTTRKARRKEEREQKKQQKRAQHQKKHGGGKAKKEVSGGSAVGNKANPANNEKSCKRKATTASPDRSPGKKARRSQQPHISSDPYANLPPEVAAAMRRDDAEIADLEVKLGLTSGSSNNNNSRDSKSRLHNEYARKECFGEDFGNFLEGLDDMMKRIVAPPTNNNDSDDAESSSSDEEEHHQDDPKKTPEESCDDDDGDSDSDVESNSSLDNGPAEAPSTE